ncbi:glycolate oxidase subunit GlcF [Novosphingobium malaysiense]|uniref:Glycolate oxidase iron-sulfur subunit n=1 Tax=Novosphingobium malaysiense TaxID=1348853 RepID=A0A0B1ZKF6_9SPHN|nr:glycolate oxidase subunit GlcF [Novosphingobium malaysiense]KHK89819.1 2-hydroxy-acid oxidase [Novosphingobium malaysiense]
MQTRFSPQQLADPATADSEQIIRKCVHCGFCTATCPTYVLLGDELDSPRGRIYLIKDMLENERQPDKELVTHVDRCLSCLSCMTTCPSGVNYMHLIDHARAYIHETYDRPWHERAYRSVLAWVLPEPGRFRLALDFAHLARPFRSLFARFALTRPLSAMLELAPSSLPSPSPVQNAQSKGTSRGRIIMLQGCAEPVLKPQYRGAAVSLLTRLGFDVVFAREETCCGALVHHMGREEAARDAARANVDAWMAEIERGDVAAIITTASGCGTVMKDYNHLLREDPDYAERAATCSALVKDVSEVLADIDFSAALRPARETKALVVAYHPACSLQHGQQIGDVPKRLLERAGFTVRVPAEAHLCCGSAGTYNILQPEISGRLAERKADAISALQADVVATGNVGCAVQIGNRMDAPVFHTVELLDWATGGDLPPALARTMKDKVP